MQVTRQ